MLQSEDIADFRALSGFGFGRFCRIRREMGILHSIMVLKMGILHINLKIKMGILNNLHIFAMLNLIKTGK